MFKVGDKITVKKNGPWAAIDASTVAGKTGLIEKVSSTTFVGYDYCVDFGEFRRRHWWVAAKDVFPFEDDLSTTLPTDAGERKSVPIITGVFDYFPAALAEVARVSKAGNDQHNPGQPLHWSRGKSSDHDDCLGRHLLERGKKDVDGQRHTAKAAWRILALLQLELEAEGAPIARGLRRGEEMNKEQFLTILESAKPELAKSGYKIEWRNVLEFINSPLSNLFFEPQNSFVYEFKALQADAVKICEDHGFNNTWKRAVASGDPEFINAVKGLKLALIVGEVSEALEGVRRGNKPDNHIPEFTSEEAELADAVIRIMNYASDCGARLAEAIVAKNEFNRTRPFKHGGKAF